MIYLKETNRVCILNLAHNFLRLECYCCKNMQSIMTFFVIFCLS